MVAAEQLGLGDPEGTKKTGDRKELRISDRGFRISLRRGLRAKMRNRDDAKGKG
jgi:hypothetical protein